MNRRRDLLGTEVTRTLFCATEERQLRQYRIEKGYFLRCPKFVDFSYCNCIKAQFDQLCSKCGIDILREDCIHEVSHKVWCHTVCPPIRRQSHK